jgi:hypothetical protein
MLQTRRNAPFVFFTRMDITMLILFLFLFFELLFLFLLLFLLAFISESSNFCAKRGGRMYNINTKRLKD